MSKIQSQIIVFFLFTTIGFAQPYVDIASFTYQYFSSSYKNDTSLKNQTSNYALNLFFPKEFKNGNIFLFRINTELIHSAVPSESDNLSGISLPVGFQFTSKSKKWKTVVMGIPKLASGFEGSITSEDWQYGGLVLENYSFNENFKLKAGLYYNREAFGNFFVPLLGIDWKASERIYFYGVLPTNYKVEYTLMKNKWYTGVDFKSVTRSFHISDSQDYVRFDEMVLKLFAEGFIYKNILLSGEVGYSFGKNPLQYNTLTDKPSDANLLYTPLKKYPVFNIGISYRIRNDSGK